MWIKGNWLTFKYSVYTLKIFLEFEDFRKGWQVFDVNAIKNASVKVYSTFNLLVKFGAIYNILIDH